MSAEHLTEDLELYRTFWNNTEDDNRVSKFLNFLNKNPNAASRENALGHLTGATLIVDPTHQKALFTLHAKLNKWLQLGGHADGNFNVYESALREAQEESSLSEFKFHSFYPGTRPSILDLDIHLIPPRKSEPAHYHYDIRYLLETPHPEQIQITHESVDLQWFSISEAYQRIEEDSIHRMLDKLQYLNGSSSQSIVGSRAGFDDPLPELNH